MITFQCEHCHKEVKAPDEAGGKRGKCPYCGGANYVPVQEDPDEIPLAPIDEDEERRHEEEVRRLLEQERELIAQTGGAADEVREQGGDYAAEDLYHHVVNYVLDMSQSNLERAAQHARILRQYGFTGIQAVEDFLTGKTSEQAMDSIPEKLRVGFLKQLQQELRSKV